MSHMLVNNNVLNSELQALVPEASNTLGDWLIERVIEWLSTQFFSMASSAMETAEETKFGTMVA